MFTLTEMIPRRRDFLPASFRIVFTRVALNNSDNSPISQSGSKSEKKYAGTVSVCVNEQVFVISQHSHELETIPNKMGTFKW